MRRLPRSLAMSVCVFTLLTAARIQAADRADDLLRLVDSRAGLCLEIDDFEAQLEVLKQSAFLDRLVNSSLYASWKGSNEYQKLRRGREALERLTGKRIGRYVREIFGESVVVAVYPSPNESTSFLVLSQADDRRVLDETIEAWNLSEPQESDTLTHGGLEYIRRTALSDRKRYVETFYYAALGRTFALSDDEQLIKNVLELSTAGDNDSVSASQTEAGDGPIALGRLEVYSTTRKSIADDSLVAAYINPRAWDHCFGPATRESSLLRLLESAWKELESIAVGLRGGDGAVLGAWCRYSERPGVLASHPPQQTDELPQFLESVPARALIVATGRSSFVGLDTLLFSLFDEDERPDLENLRQVSRGMLLGRDLFDDVLPELGENCGLYIVPPDRPVNNCLPLAGVAAFELPASASNESSRSPSLSAALDNAMNTTLNLLVALSDGSPDRKKPVVHTDEAAGTTLRWMDSFGAYQPAYAITGEQFVVGSSPQLVREFLAGQPADNFTASPRYQRLRADFFPSENQLLYIDMAGLRRLVDVHRDRFLEHLSASEELAKEAAEAELRDFESLLELCESAFVAGSVGEREFRIVVGGVVEPSAEADSAQ